MADFLLHAHTVEAWQPHNPTFFIDRPYSKLYNMVTSLEEDATIQKLAEYLTKDWYPAHHVAGWHDTHEIDDYVYQGYWL